MIGHQQVHLEQIAKGSRGDATELAVLAQGVLELQRELEKLKNDLVDKVSAIQPLVVGDEQVLLVRVNGELTPECRNTFASEVRDVFRDVRVAVADDRVQFEVMADGREVIRS